MKTKGKTSDAVAAYIAAAPKEARPKLMQLRKIIKAAAPGADERISYGMPYYGFHGRLAYFRLAKNYVGLYIPPPIIEENRGALKAYVTSKSAVHFPPDKKLPVALIHKLVRARMKKNRQTSKNSGYG